LDFRILGLLEAADDTGPLDLPRGKERAVLAALLLHANEPVSAGTLVDALWTTAPPVHASKTVQIYISRLRKTRLGTRIATTRGGYVLRVQPEELDSWRFEAALVDARAALDAGDAARADRLLVGADQLWRGPALADFRFDDFAQAEIERLEELRLQAALDRVDARLALGAADELVPELRALIAEHPFAERPRAQLMLSLYRAGRQGDALDAYRETRRTLLEELGVGPGPELRELERRIHTQDETLAGRRRPPLVRSRGRRGLVAGGVAAIALAAAIAITTSRGGGGMAILEPGSIGSVDPGSLELTKAVGDRETPTRIAADGEGVWIGNDDTGVLTRLDASATPRRVVASDAFPTDIAVDGNAAWVLDGSSGILSRVDRSYGTLTGRVRVASDAAVSYDRSRESPDASSVAAGLGYVWTTDGTATIARVDPRTLKVRRIDLRRAVNGVAAGGGAVWAISGRAATVSRLDRAGRVAATIPVVTGPTGASPYPLDVAVGGGSVWILEGNTATVTRVDPDQRTVAATIRIGVEHRPAHIAASRDAAWVANADGTLARIDAQTNALTLRREAPSLRDVAATENAVWVTAGAASATLSGDAVVTRGALHIRPLPTSACSALEYEGGADPRFIVAGDLGLQGTGEAAGPQAAEAVRFVLRRHHYRAGRYSVAYQTCDDSNVAGGPDDARCTVNAKSFAENRAVLAVIGTFSSGCTRIELPIANRAGLAMVAPSNTYVGLTHKGPGMEADEPQRYRPSGVNSFFRLAPSDDVQAAAVVLLARRLGARSVFIVTDGEPYGGGIAADFATAAARAGLRVLGQARWRFLAPNYNAVISAAAASHADAVFLGTFLIPESAFLIRRLHAVMPRAQILAPDGFTPLSDLIARAGAAAEGMTVTIPGIPATKLGPAGRRFVAEFAKETGERNPAPATIEAAQATEVVLAAIARSNGTRTSVLHELARTRVHGGILGSFRFDANGDITNDAVTLYRILGGRAKVVGVATPPRLP
jgi:DNA-binding SARP family transcriptional activator/ABC-type branched-subunit amino acid transport system substrate-binding protein